MMMLIKYQFEYKARKDKYVGLGRRNKGRVAWSICDQLCFQSSKT